MANLTLADQFKRHESPSPPQLERTTGVLRLKVCSRDMQLAGYQTKRAFLLEYFRHLMVA